MQELSLEFFLVKPGISLAFPSKLRLSLIGLSISKTLFDEAPDCISHELRIDNVTITIFGEIEEHFIAEGLFNLIVKSLVKFCKGSYTKRRKTLILQVVSV